MLRLCHILATTNRIDNIATLPICNQLNYNSIHFTL